MLVTPPFGASSNTALWRAYSKPPVELVVADLEQVPGDIKYILPIKREGVDKQ